jgi:hypothetical protein
MTPDIPRPINYTKLAEVIKVATILIDNGLNQAVNVQVKAGRDTTIAKLVNVGSSFLVSAGGVDARTLTPGTSGWLPYVTVTVWCTTAPTSGSLTIWRVRSKDDQVKIVDALAIRDTNTHDASTDPNNIFIVEW